MRLGLALFLFSLGLSLGARCRGAPGASTAGLPEARALGPASTKRVQSPNPIISRGAQTFASSGTGAFVVDGKYRNGSWEPNATPSVAAPLWVALKLAPGPTRVLVSWDDGGSYNYNESLSPYDPSPATQTTYGFPADYQIQTSADSTNGSDGTWTAEARVTGNLVHTRAHAIPFAGKTWVRLFITAAPSTISRHGIQIDEIDVHDLSSSPGACLPDDTWFFMGDSITAFAYDRGALHQPSFAAGIHAGVPAYFPAMINGGIGGETSVDALARLPQALTENPDYRFFVLGYGTNDAGHNLGTAAFRANMQAMITLVKAAGRTPVIPRIPFASKSGYEAIPSYNGIIDALVTENGLSAGPDLYALLKTNAPDYFTCGCSGPRATDGLHPNDAGLAAMNAAWAKAMRSLYP